MSNPNKLSYSHILAKWTLLGQHYPDIKTELDAIREEMEHNLASAHKQWEKLVYAEENKDKNIPLSLFAELYSAGTGGGIQKKQKKERPRFSFGSKESLEKSETEKRLQKVLTKEAIRVATDDRSDDAYKYSEGFVFKQWCDGARISKDNQVDLESFKLSEELKQKDSQFQTEADKDYILKNQEKFHLYFNLEKEKIYDKPQEDPVLKELTSMLAEAKIKDKESKELEETQRKRNILKAFKEMFPEKTKRYLSIRNNLKEKHGEDITLIFNIVPPETWNTLDELSYASTAPSEEERRTFVPPSRSGGGFINDINSFASNVRSMFNFGSKIGPVVGGGGAAAGTGAASGGAAAGGAAAAAGTSPIWIWPAIIIAAVMVFFLIVFLIIFVVGRHAGNLAQSEQIVIEKSVVPNQSQIKNLKDDPTSQTTFNINVIFFGQTTQAIVTDPIPENAEFVSAGPANVTQQLLDASGQKTTNPSEVKAVQWTISGNGTTSGGKLPINNSNFGDWLNKKLSEDPSHSGLQGTGQVLANLSVQHNVPIELALGQFWLETQWYSDTGITVRKQTNNPGNIKCGSDECRQRLGATSKSISGYSTFPTLEKGIEAYFLLLDSSRYRTAVDNFISTSNPRPVIRIYYQYEPGYATEDEYVDTVNTIVKRLRDAAVKDGIYLQTTGGGNTSTGTTAVSNSQALTITLKPKPDAIDTYIVNQAFAEAVGDTGAGSP